MVTGSNVHCMLPLSIKSNFEAPFIYPSIHPSSHPSSSADPIQDGGSIPATTGREAGYTPVQQTGLDLGDMKRGLDA